MRKALEPDVHGGPTRYPSIRVAIVASLCYLILWIASSLTLALAGWAGDSSLTSAFFEPAWNLYLPAMGFIGLMIMGMAQQFVPLYSGRELWSSRGAMLQVSVAIVGVALLLVNPLLELLGLALWLLGALLFILGIAMTLRSPRLPVRPQGKHPEFHRMDVYGIPMTSAAVLYLVAASVGFLSVSPSDARWFLFFHLYTLGFVALMVFGVGFHLLPRFMDTVPRLGMAKVIVAMALPGPAMVAITMPFLDMPSVEFVFALSALFEAVAAVLFALLILDLWTRCARRRPASAFNAVAGLWLSCGVAFGSLFGIAPSLSLAWAPAHGWINLLGFAGFEIFGVTHEVLPPFTSMGLKVSRSVTRVDFALANLGLALVVLSFATVLSGFSTAGSLVAIAGFVLLLVMSAIYAVGTAYSLFGIVQPRGSK